MQPFPYGIADFAAIIGEGYFYIDRTDRIPLIEAAGKQLLFLRPRRFGKSLWLSTLENYYDLARADHFERLFGGLKIGRNPTLLRNRYFVMRWDFSTVDPGGDLNAIRRSLFNHVNVRIKDTIARYGDWLDGRVEVNPDDGLASLQSLLSAVSRTPHKLYLLVDEYDNFANEVMISPLRSAGRYQERVEGEGIIKTLFKVVKSGASGSGIDRVFLTGVSPVMLSDMTSGYNVAKDITHLDEYYDLCGFTAGELAEALAEVLVARSLPDERAPEILDFIRRFYNGYRFGEGNNPLLYNPTLALYFLDYFGRYGRYPHQMLDDNLAMDRNRIQYVARLPHGEALVNAALNPAKPLAIAQLLNRFGVRGDMLTVPRDPAFLASLLYYFGVLTLAGRDEWGELLLAIPNQVIRKLYVERLQEQVLPNYDDQKQRQALCRRFYATGDLGPLCDFLEQRYFKVFDNRDLRWSNELVVKTAFLVTLFNDTSAGIQGSQPESSRIEQRRTGGEDAGRICRRCRRWRTPCGKRKRNWRSIAGPWKRTAARSSSTPTRWSASGWNGWFSPPVRLNDLILLEKLLTD